MTSNDKLPITKSEAQTIYKRAWLQWCLAQDPKEKRSSEIVMDSVQSRCVDSGKPGPEWEEFIDTLPGYREHWNGLAVSARKMIAALERNK